MRGSLASFVTTYMVGVEKIKIKREREEANEIRKMKWKNS